MLTAPGAPVFVRQPPRYAGWLKGAARDDPPPAISIAQSTMDQDNKVCTRQSTRGKPKRAHHENVILVTPTCTEEEPPPRRKPSLGKGRPNSETSRPR